MALHGKAIFLGWHDVASDGLANFYEWHDREHIPERMRIPGFVRIRRYRAHADGPLIANLMELAGADVLAGPAYQHVAANPTEWTRRTVPSLERISRGIYTVSISRGQADGGFLALARDLGPRGTPDEIDDYLGSLALSPQVVAAHYCIGEKDAIVLIEAASASAASAAAGRLTSSAAPAPFQVGAPVQVYQLETAHGRDGYDR